MKVVVVSILDLMDCRVKTRRKKTMMGKEKSFNP